MPDAQRIYWDSNVFLSYINGVADRLPTIDAAFTEVQASKGGLVIITSQIAVTEVAFSVYEKEHKQLDANLEQRLDDLWGDTNVVELVEYYSTIAREARRLMRLAIGKGWSLKPLDAIHLATAKEVQCVQFHTYDEFLDKYSPDINLSIERPHTQGPVQLRAALDEPAASVSPAETPSLSADADAPA